MGPREVLFQAWGHRAKHKSHCSHCEVHPTRLPTAQRHSPAPPPPPTPGPDKKLLGVKFPFAKRKLFGPFWYTKPWGPSHKPLPWNQILAHA